MPISIHQIDIRKITSKDVNDIVPYVRSNHSYDLCIGALLDNEIIGVITARKFENNIYVIDQFYVLPLFRSMGIGSKLIHAMRYELILLSANRMRLKFNSREHSLKPYNKFLNEKLKIEPYQTSSLYRISLKDFHDIFILRYFHKNSSPLDEHNIIFLSNLEESQIKKKFKLIDNFAPASLHPFNNTDNILKDCSFLVINKKQEIIAWTVLEKIKYDEVGVKATYVIPPYRTTLLGLALWNRLYLRAFETGLAKEIKWISFHFDSHDNRNSKLYQLLFGKYERVNYYNADYVF